MSQFQRLVNRCEIACCLIDDQIADDARVGVGNAGVGAVVGVGDSWRARAWRAEWHPVAVGIIEKHGRHQTRHYLVGRTDQALPGEQVVVAAIYGAKSGWEQRADRRAVEVGQEPGRDVLFSDFDLLKNVEQVS